MLEWEKVKGYRNLNAELVKKRSWIKRFGHKILGKKLPFYIRYIRMRKGLNRSFEKHKEYTLQKQKGIKIAIIFIGTKKFVRFINRYYNSLEKNFLPNIKKDYYVFTNEIGYPFLPKNNIYPIKIEHENSSFATLLRFKYIVSIKQKLIDKKYSHIIYIDADMYAQSRITEEEFFYHKKPLFGVQHPYYVERIGPFEQNQASSAKIKKSDDKRNYYQGCFWGGKIADVIKLIETLNKNVQKDLKNKIIAKWLDESHLNKYLIDHKKEVHTYSPLFAYPEEFPIKKGYKKKLVHCKGNILN